MSQRGTQNSLVAATIAVAVVVALLWLYLAESAKTGHTEARRGHANNE
jgi:hypothetical protein